MNDVIDVDRVADAVVGCRQHHRSAQEHLDLTLGPVTTERPVHMCRLEHSRRETVFADHPPHFPFTRDVGISGLSDNLVRFVQRSIGPRPIDRHRAREHQTTNGVFQAGRAEQTGALDVGLGRGVVDRQMKHRVATRDERIDGLRRVRRPHIEGPQLDCLRREAGQPGDVPKPTYPYSNGRPLLDQPLD